MVSALGSFRPNVGFAALVLTALAARLLMAWLLPPLLDVYYYDTQAAQAILRGIDPYGFNFVAIPAWLATPGASNVFVYLPGVVLFLAPFASVWDIRLGLIAADLLVAWGIYAIGGNRARTATLVYLLLPFTPLFSTSYPNNTLVAMAFLGPSVVFWLRGRNVYASILFGVALASSQFTWLLYPIFAIWSLRSGRFRYALSSAVVAFALTLPFLLSNWSTFINDTLFFEFSRTPRTIISAAAFGLNVNPTLNGITTSLFGASVPFVVRGLATLAALVYALSKSKELSGVLLNGSWFILLAIFLLPNVFSWWYLELPFQLLLMWFVLPRARMTPEVR
ncbi:MAG: hypothetical protein LYZ70_07340 [Nitrososphaerales archaeon]|nr:hypothetical protein [Nitrososphaerales archaeon]